MSDTTQIHPDKIQAYLATDYRLGHTAKDIILTIGQRSERLATLFAANGVNCGAFLTACNPRGHAELASLLRERGLTANEGSGSEEGTDWPAEKSWFALALPLDPAKVLGRHFDQDAIVWVGADGRRRAAIDPPAMKFRGLAGLIGLGVFEPACRPDRSSKSEAGILMDGLTVGPNHLFGRISQHTLLAAHINSEREHK